MSNIVRRNDSNEQLASRDPFQWMRDLMRWDPFREAAPIGPKWEPTFTPAFEVKETKDSFQFKADLPGIKESDVEVTLTGNRLAITGKRELEKQDSGDTFYTYERSFGSFQRVFALPDGLDTEHVIAELKDGVLNVTIPKRQGTQSKTVAVKTGEQPKS